MDRAGSSYPVPEYAAILTIRLSLLDFLSCLKPSKGDL